MFKVHGNVVKSCLGSAGHSVTVPTTWFRRGLLYLQVALCVYSVTFREPEDGKTIRMKSMDCYTCAKAYDFAVVLSPQRCEK